MPSTYSLSVGTSIEALRKTDINSVLLDLPDNSQKLISPKDVRDAFVTTWATSAFKHTIGQGAIEYIGIDSGDPENRDIKQKIFLGKRNWAGTDIMNSNLLGSSNPNDIYFFNTKEDNVSQDETRIAILAGTNSTLHQYAPYISSKVSDDGLGSVLNFVNPSLFSGPINIYSQTGRVAINGITFPSVSETAASASNGKILKYYGTYPNGSLRWADSTVSIANIGTPGSPTYIYGSPSNVNGYSLEFVDDTLTPQDVGGVPVGSSFSAGSFFTGTAYQNWPLSEVIRLILYPYVPPALSLSIDTGSFTYLETGVTSSATFSFGITRKSNDIANYQLTGTTYSGTYSGLINTQVGFTFSLSNIYSGISTTQDYVLEVSDVPGLLTYSYSLTASVTFVSPYCFTFSSTAMDFGTTSGVLTTQATNLIATSQKYVYTSTQSVSNKYYGSGYLYFLVPYSYHPVSIIKDPNGFIIYDSSNPTAYGFTVSGSITPTGYDPYRIYRTTGICGYTASGYFEFIM